MRYRRSRQLLIATSTLVAAGSLPSARLAAQARQSGATADSIRGFSGEAAGRERTLEAELARTLRRDSTGAFFRYLTDEPHPAGSVRNKQLADFIAERYRAWGLDHVQLHRYDVLLPWPREVKVTMTAPTVYEATLREDAYAQDPHSSKDPGITYLGMSASGDVTGELVYASSGNPSDYDWLEQHGVDLKGKIALVRYSVPYSYRGFKALTAEKRGLRALLIYSDPAEDGFRKGKTFPDGPWGPESHIQRGSITYDFMVAGDPLTPGYASIPGAPRIKESDALSMPKIMMVPMSYRDAKPLLQALGGPEAPSSWQGALGFPYHVGAGPATVRVKVDMDDSTRAIWVVEGRITGSEEPDKYVVLGNHRDAWVFGAVDPSSGTATQMELARTLGAQAKAGRRPKRTIVFASWDAEEWHLTGSTEWGEQFADDLRRNAIAYLNVDGSTSGSKFDAGAIASLNALVSQTVRDVKDPTAQGSVLDSWGRALKSEVREATIGGGAAHETAAKRPIDYPGNALGSGSDYTVFLNFLGLPIVEMSFNGPYGVYHSAYDDYYWMTHFGDPGFKYMTAMAEVWGRMALRLANAEHYPHDFGIYAQRVGGFIDAMEAQPSVKAKLTFTRVRAAQQSWSDAAMALEGALRSTLAAAPSPARVRALAAANEAMRVVEQQFLNNDGIPGRPWFKHVLYAPRYTYAAMTLPGVQEAVDAGDWARAAAQLDIVASRIEGVAGATRRAAAAAVSSATR
jgi:N-acetylated-alpha-linked acidic dipeptidase